MQHSTTPPCRLILAPMEGVTEFPMRIWFALISQPETVYTPFLRVTKTYPWREIPETFAPELSTLKGVTPYTLRPQIMATEADDVLRFYSYVQDMVEVLDLNCGCPSPTCTGKGAGSSLLRDLPAFDDMLSEMVAGMGPGKLSVKIRLGYNDEQEFPAILAILQRHALRHVTIHGRTRPQRYKGVASWEHIALAARELSMPVIGSGDVVDRKSLHERLLLTPGLSEVMIGRGALRNPWLFSDLGQSTDTEITGSLLSESLLIFADLQSIWLKSPGTLIDLVGNGLLDGATAKSHSVLQEKRQVIARASADLSDDAKIDGQVLGRTKMLWNYLRSSLPPEFFAPQLLREKSVTGLVTAVAELAKSCPYITLKHRAELDWIYAGGKN